MKTSLPVRDRVLVHLLDYIDLKNPTAYPWQTTQDGIALVLDSPRGYVQQQLAVLIENDYVECVPHRVEGGRKLMKVYLLKPRGIEEATRLKKAIQSGIFTVVEDEDDRPTLPAEDSPAPAVTDWRQPGIEGGDAAKLRNGNGPATRDHME